ncbi:LysE family translocator [Maridesulfovibrio sp.]|uniref:LysE family translocator n=1 Tax=Maridesulfovibrio sp. TaxID=2795000 RepID=UPI0029F51C38|nr:LysE family translocator [Maridesulfovibrio sp.]
MNLFNVNLALIGVVTVLAVVSPGPDFAIVFRNGLRYGRKMGLATAFGVAGGVVVHITYALLGLSYVVAEYTWVLMAVRYAGAAYLLWLGVSAFLPRKSVEDQAESCADAVYVSFGEAFRNGFLCNALNPKTMLFFVALFTQVVTPGTSLVLKMSIGAFISLTHLVWFAFIVFVLTDQRTAKLVARWRKGVEKVVGVCLFGLGAKLALDA